MLGRLFLWRGPVVIPALCSRAPQAVRVDWFFPFATPSPGDTCGSGWPSGPRARCSVQL